MDPFELLSVISGEYQRILGKNLCGIYVHGSLAFGCFSRDRSDIDFLVAVYKELTQGQKESLILTLLRLNQAAPPKGFEMSVVLFHDCQYFHYPTSFQLHYSNAHIKKTEENLSEYCRTMNGTDFDLAAHFTVVKKAGIVLFGKPIEEVFGEVPGNAYLASIKLDVEDAERDMISNPVYITLNLCRVLAYLKTGLVLSKGEGGKWAVACLSDEYAGFVRKALDCYLTDREYIADGNMGQKFARYMKKIIFTN